MDGKIIIGAGEFKVEIPENLLWEDINWRQFVKRDNVALLAIDFENDCCTEGGLLDKVGWQSWEIIRKSGAIENTIKIVEEFRRIDAPVIWARVFRKKGFADMKPGTYEHAAFNWYNNLAPGVFCEGTWDVEIVDELLAVQKPEDLVIDKPQSIAFTGTILERYLRNWQIDCLVVTGVFTDYCVEGTVRVAQDLGFLNIVVGDATMARDIPTHENALARMEKDFGHIVSTEDTIKLLRTL